jgi:acyl dehydratase
MSLLFGKIQGGDALPALELPVTARTVVMGASSSRDWQPQHHDYAWATTRAGTKDIFLNTPNQAGWIERYLTDWTGAHGRLGRIKFRMRRPVYPGETLVFGGTVRETAVDESGCAWVDVDLELTVGDEVATEASARLAVPQDESDNPWRRSGDDWRP